MQSKMIKYQDKKNEANLVDMQKENYVFMNSLHILPNIFKYGLEYFKKPCYVR